VLCSTGVLSHHAILFLLEIDAQIFNMDAYFMSSIERRNLSFQAFDEVLADIDRIQVAGYTQAGKWNLSQICSHLNDWMTFPLDGFPKQILPIRVMLFLMKITIGKSQFRTILRRSQMKSGMPTMPETVHPPSGDDATAIEKFRQTVVRMRDYRGEVHPSPLFGTMDLDSAKRLQLIHCAHHLSFLVPQSEP